MYTWASSRGSDARFADLYRSLGLWDRTLRFSNAGDVIPLLNAPALTNYTHVGQLVTISKAACAAVRGGAHPAVLAGGGCRGLPACRMPVPACSGARARPRTPPPWHAFAPGHAQPDAEAEEMDTCAHLHLTATTTEEPGACRDTLLPFMVSADARAASAASTAALAVPSHRAALVPRR